MRVGRSQANTRIHHAHRVHKLHVYSGPTQQSPAAPNRLLHAWEVMNEQQWVLLTVVYWFFNAVHHSGSSGPGF